MPFRTATKPSSPGQAGEAQSPYHDTMIDHDKNVGDVLDHLDKLGITDNTFVMYSTDNGPHTNTWPDGGMTTVPQREGHELGGSLSRAAARAMAGKDPCRHRDQ